MDRPADKRTMLGTRPTGYPPPPGRSAWAGRLVVVTHNVIRGDGQGRANYELARFALRQGWEVHLLADRVDEDLLQAGARWTPLQPRVLRQVNLFKVLEFAARANRWLKRHGAAFDIIHGYGYCLDAPHHVNTSQFVHAAWLQSPVHTAKQQKNLYAAYQYAYSALNARCEKRAYAAAKIVVAASSTVRRELQEVGIPKERLRVILNGADLSEFHPAQAPEERRRRPWNLPEDRPLALFGGDLRTPRKNLDTVLKALAHVPELHLAVVGRTEGSPFPTLAEQLGVGERTHFLGFRRDIADLMRAADFFVFPSRYEACALVLAEATASGLPIITAKTTGGAELVTPESGILLEDANDAGALATAMQTLADDPEQRRQMGAAAWTRAQTNTWEHIGQAYLGVYQEVAA